MNVTLTQKKCPYKVRGRPVPSWHYELGSTSPDILAIETFRNQ